jgi:hypothetical protein
VKKVSLGLCAGMLFCCLSGIATAQKYDQYVPRPITLGTLGGNVAYTSFQEEVGGQTGIFCTNEEGTLGALVADQNNNQYILGAAHVLAVGPAAYFGTNSQEPIMQPGLKQAWGEDPPTTPSCLPQGGVNSLEVAKLNTVVSINFSAGAVNTVDAALAQVIPGMVGSSQYGIKTYSGTPLAVEKKGMLVQKFGASTGLKTGKIVSGKLMTERYKICTHLGVPTKANPAPLCPTKTVLFKDVMLTTTSLGNFGDSGALVMTTDSCPMPVGVYVGGDGSHDYINPIADVFPALISASGGALTSLSIVPGGVGCTPGSHTADPDVLAADAAQPGSGVVLAGNSNFQGCIDGVGEDLSGAVATLDVIADDGSVVVNGSNETCLSVVQTNAAAQLGSPATFDSVPVEVSQINTVDLTQGGNFWSPGGTSFDGYTAGTVNSTTLAAPPSVQTGDLMLVVFVQNANGIVEPPFTPTYGTDVPYGWNYLGITADPSNQAYLTVFSHTANAADVPGNTYPFVFPANNNQAVGEMRAYSNAAIDNGCSQQNGFNGLCIQAYSQNYPQLDAPGDGASNLFDTEVEAFLTEEDAVIPPTDLGDVDEIGFQAGTNYGLVVGDRLITSTGWQAGDYAGSSTGKDANGNAYSAALSIMLRPVSHGTAVTSATYPGYLTAPAYTQPGDEMLAYLAYSNGEGCVPNFPIGWTFVDVEFMPYNTGYLWLFQHTATSSDMGGQQYTGFGPNPVAGCGSQIVGGVTSYSNAALGYGCTGNPDPNLADACVNEYAANNQYPEANGISNPIPYGTEFEVYAVDTSSFAPPSDLENVNVIPFSSGNNLGLVVGDRPYDAQTGWTAGEWGTTPASAPFATINASIENYWYQ